MTRKFLFVSGQALVHDLALQVQSEGHAARYAILAKSEKEVADGFVEKVDDWEAHVDWADVIVFDDNEFGGISEKLRAAGKAVIGICGPRLYLLYSGSTPDGFSIHASKGLLWHVVNQEYARGIRECNLGGVPPDSSAPDSVDHGLYRFKQGFGGAERVCISGHKVLRPVAAGCRRALARVRSLLRLDGPRPQTT